MNKLLVASAGAGKTTYVVNESIERAKEGASILITTFTEACKDEIYKKIIEKNGCVPSNIHIITWFSFMIKHGIKPFQGVLFNWDVKGMLLCNGRSGLRYVTATGRPIYWGEEKNFKEHYFDSQCRLFSDKLSKLALRCDDKSEGKVFNRLSKCFSHIYIDEVQDLAGFDLEILQRLFDADINVTLVGDPRQATYSTANTAKNKKYKRSEIVNFFLDADFELETDTTSLLENHRCFNEITLFANNVYPLQKYPDYPQASSNKVEVSGHDGVFAVGGDDVDSYLEKFQPVQLRDTKRTKVNDSYPVFNIGVSKGLTFDRVIIYPSSPMVNWFLNNDFELNQMTRAKLYVALTRPIKSVAIVFPSVVLEKIVGIKKFSNI
ncbi:UvrD-helicase domain-containing protein [Buttiauxella gaviniae]|uniref:UvrD-helicase domain-containing protein n=1 Tax=Buttiauxella gaviniae TaxID=82990 RepID=UPI0039769D8F